MPNQISQFFVLSSRGDRILTREYRQDIVQNSDLIFFRHVRALENPAYSANVAPSPTLTNQDELVKPAFNIDGINFIYVKKNSMYFVFTTAVNASPQYLLELLNRMLLLFKDFTGVLSEQSLRFNFTLMYELMDEMLDGGHVQNTTTSLLSYYVMNPAVDLEKHSSLLSAVNTTGFAVTGLFFEQKTAKASASARSVIDKTDDIYVDILEKVDVEFSGNGSVLRSEILGSIVVRSFLKGEPLLKFGLNTNLFIGQNGGSSSSTANYGDVVLDAVNFYSHANLTEFKRDKVVSLYPIDGEFTVLNYRVTSENAARPWSLPIRLYPRVELLSEYRARVVIRIMTDLGKSSHVSNVIVRVPIPKFCTAVTSVSFDEENRSNNSYEYKADDNCLLWGIRRVSNGLEQSITLHLSLDKASPVQSQLWYLKRQLGPIGVKFEVPMHNLSGLQLRFLKIGDYEESNKDIKRWVRYVCQGGNYMCRMDGTD